jgi:hypothetical protein
MIKVSRIFLLKIVEKPKEIFDDYLKHLIKFQPLLTSLLFLPKDP